jgi:hypothetical protein
MVNPTYQFLDLVPKGRDENPEDPQDWVRYHDEYKDEEAISLRLLKSSEAQGQGREDQEVECGGGAKTS